MDMTDQFSDDRNFGEDPSRLSRVLTFLASGLVVAILYFARDIIVPITLAILLSFLLSPAVRALRRPRVGRIAAVAITALVSFLIILGFAAVVVQEISSLAGDLPRYRSNLEAKVHSLPELVPGTGVFRRAAAMLQDLRNELARSQTHVQTDAGRSSPTGNPIDTEKPLPVEIKQPGLEPLPLVRSIVGPLLQPLAAAGLVVVFVIMILIDWEDLRDRLLRLAGRSDLHRTTEAMNDAAQRVSRYLARQLIVNVTCGVPIGVGLTVIGIPNAALWGIFVVVLRFVPYLGIVIAAGFPLALAIAVDPGWSLLLWTISLFVVVEPTVAYLVEPRVYGAGTGLSDRRDPGRGILDMALGPYRAITVGAAHNMSCRPRPACSAFSILGCDLGQPACLGPRRDVLSAPARKRSRGSGRTSRGGRQRTDLGRVFRRGRSPGAEERTGRQ
jgi:predicted PurR-regulated permease PerM